MRTFQQLHDDLNRSGNPCAYWGEHGDWLVAMGRNRDSDILTNCNWDVFVEMLDGLGGDEDTYTIESENHWAVGWVEYVLINPARQDAIDMANQVNSDLEDYPVLDDDAFSAAEEAEFEESWRAWGARELRQLLVDQYMLGERTEAYLDSVDDMILASWWQDAASEPYYCTNSGCCIQIKSHVDNMDRRDLAALLRYCRQWQVIW
jgi:hypothetical protein